MRGNGQPLSAPTRGKTIHCPERMLSQLAGTQCRLRLDLSHLHHRTLRVLLKCQRQLAKKPLTPHGKEQLHSLKGLENLGASQIAMNHRSRSL
jgi:hypothetical protein